MSELVDTIAKGRLLALVAANAPVFYLHPDDHYMPCSAEWFSAFFSCLFMPMAPSHH